MRAAVPSPAVPAGPDRGAADDLAADVRRDLSLTPKQLQSKYLYDELGSFLFEAICRLPWYRIARAEHALLSRHAASILSRLTDPIAMVELGCGSGEKLSILAENAVERGRLLRIQLIDISPAALESSARALGRFRHLSIVGHRATYEVGLQRAAAGRLEAGSMLALFLGSNIGNFDPPVAGQFLQSIRKTLRRGDALLLGVDLVKPEEDLILAYDDPLGVTAAFNKNLLVRINRDLGADFRLGAFKHAAVWNAEAHRVEMHLVSRRRQRVAIPGAAFSVEFGDGESIWTESSYKYEPDTILAMGRESGFDAPVQWIDLDAGFALTLFRV